MHCWTALWAREGSVPPIHGGLDVHAGDEHQKPLHGDSRSGPPPGMVSRESACASSVAFSQDDLCATVAMRCLRAGRWKPWRAHQPGDAAPVWRRRLFSGSSSPRLPPLALETAFSAINSASVWSSLAVTPLHRDDVGVGSKVGDEAGEGDQWWERTSASEACTASLDSTTSGGGGGVG